MLDQTWHCGQSRDEWELIHKPTHRAQLHSLPMDPCYPSLELVLYQPTSAVCHCHSDNPISRDPAKRNAVLTIGSYPLTRPPSWNSDQLWGAGQLNQCEAQSSSGHLVDFTPWEEGWRIPQRREMGTEAPCGSWFELREHCLSVSMFLSLLFKCSYLIFVFSNFTCVSQLICSC